MIAAAVDAPLALLELGAILFAMALIGRAAGRFGIPSIPLFLLLGLLLGKGGLVPIATAGEFIDLGAQIGVIVLLLLLGLEYSGQELTRSLRTNWTAGAADAVLNFTPGFVGGLLLGFTTLGSVFLGGITYISSSGIIAKQLSDLGWMGNRETPTVLSILVIEDFAMAVYLPIVTGLVAHATVADTAVTVTVAVVAGVVVLVIATRYGRPVSRLMFGTSHDPEVILLGVLGLALVVAAFAEQARISAAVAAFLVGIAISGETATRARVVLAPIRDLFAAVFFVFVGLEIDPSTIPPVFGAAVALAVVTAATKVATGWVAARRRGVGAAGRWRAGSALIARGEFSIVIAELAVLADRDGRLAPLATTYVLLLAIAGPLVTRWSDWRSQVRRPPETEST